MHKLLAAILVTLALGAATAAEAKDSFKLAWSHYTGWEPWGYADEKGIVKKWAGKYGIDVEVVLFNDYIESVNQFTAGTVDGVTVTNMDALSIPAVGGIDTTALVIGDFSDGNDGILSSEVKDVKGLKGREVKLVELSVSHYLLARALDMNGLRERDIKVVNTSDADIGGIFLSNGGNVVTWNPILMSLRSAPKANLVFDSSKIPGEIIDMLVVRSDGDERLKKALTGAWYETVAIMGGKGRASDEAIAFMARQAGGTVPEFKAQLKTTRMFYTPQEGVKLARSPELKKTMKYVAQFSFDHGLYGEGAPSADLVGIQFPDGTIQGDKNNVKLRFDASFMEKAANGEL